jgi:hypothetical protein
MPTPTYTPLATVTLASGASSVTFSSIPATYRDLVLVSVVAQVNNTGHQMRANGDTGSNYSLVQMFGDGSTATSNSGTLAYFTPFVNNNPATNTGSPVMGMTQIMDYSATDKHKTILCTNSGLSGLSPMVARSAFRWANTAAITTLVAFAVSGDIAAGSTFNLYGIAA